ncbi:MAG: hypothetical protein Q9199_002468 [Rusavskia elegans]
MTSNANLDRLNEIAATIGSRVATLHETAEQYPDSRVTSVFRDRITNTFYSHVENAMQQATAEINRLKMDFEVELRASQAATKELQDLRQAADHELDELAMAREALAEKEKAIIEERNEIARQRLVLLHDQEQFKIERRKHERSVNTERTPALCYRKGVDSARNSAPAVKDREDKVNAREREATASGIAKLVNEAQQKVREVGQVAKQELSAQQENGSKRFEEVRQLAKQHLTTQDDHSDRLNQDLRGIKTSIANLAYQSQQQVHTLAEIKGLSNSLQMKVSDYSGIPATITNKLNDVLDGNTELKREFETLGINLEDLKQDSRPTSRHIGTTSDLPNPIWMRQKPPDVADLVNRALQVDNQNRHRVSLKVLLCQDQPPERKLNLKSKVVKDIPVRISASGSSKSGIKFGSKVRDGPMLIVSGCGSV